MASTRGDNVQKEGVFLLRLMDVITSCYVIFDHFVTGRSSALTFSIPPSQAVGEQRARWKSQLCCNFGPVPITPDHPSSESCHVPLHACVVVRPKHGSSLEELVHKIITPRRARRGRVIRCHVQIVGGVCREVHWYCLASMPSGGRIGVVSVAQSGHAVWIDSPLPMSAQLVLSVVPPLSV